MMFSSDLPLRELAFPALLEAAKRGERAALDELCTRYYDRVSRQVHHALATDVRNGRPWLSARFSTADIVQETFHGVLRDLDGFQGTGEDAFSAYLTMVVRNRTLDAIRFHQAERRDGRRGVDGLDEIRHHTGGADPAAAAAALDTERAYLDALNRLPERERLLVRARFDGSATFDELTAALGYTSSTTARRAFNRAKARLALMLEEQLDPEGDGDE